VWIRRCILWVKRVCPCFAAVQCACLGTTQLVSQHARHVAVSQSLADVAHVARGCLIPMLHVAVQCTHVLVNGQQS